MERLNVENLKNVCRICIRSYDMKRMRSIFRNNIDTMLLAVLPIQLSDDRLPNLICYTCFMNVKKFYNLRAEFVRNDKRVWDVLLNDSNEIDVKNVNMIDNDVKDIKVESILDELDDENELKMKTSDCGARSDISEEKDELKTEIEDPTTMFDLRSLTCNICHRSYKRLNRLKDHMIDKHTMNPSEMSLRNQLKLTGSFKCLKQSCNVIGKTLKAFTTHMDSAHRREFKRKFSCHFCFRKFFLLDHVTLHVTAYHLRGLKIPDEIKCLKCDSVFGDAHALAKHCKDAHAFAKITLVRDLCQYLITQYDGEMCKLCDKKVLNIARHNVESHAHEIAQPFKCAFCAKIFDTRVERRKHVLKMHKKNKICEICGVLYRGKTHMTTHDANKVVKETKRIACNLCGLVLKCRATMKSHVVNVHETHAGVTCDVCHAVMKASNLKKHMRMVHFKVQKHPCRLCDKVFRRSDALRKHFLVHTNERPYPCRHCEQSFREPRTRKHHEMRHTGERPYACTYCNKRFIQRSALLVHLKTHGGPETFKCDFCVQTFVFQTDLDVHCAKYHPKMDGKDDVVSAESQESGFDQFDFICPDDKTLMQRIHVNY